jgi:hypothetical protein
MNGVSYFALRQNDWYTAQQRDVDIEDRRFWCMEQLFIYKDIFVPMKKSISPMQPTDIEFLKSKEYFSSAVKVVERLGLTGLMTFQCHYDPQLILQFYATLTMGTDDEKTLKWMTGTRYCESTFTRFAALLGYPFDGPRPVGHRIHSPTSANKELLSDFYGPKGKVGTITEHLPLYNFLVRIF